MGERVATRRVLTDEDRSNRGTWRFASCLLVWDAEAVEEEGAVLLNIIPQIAWLEPTVTAKQYKALDPIGIMATEAAAAAISAKQYNTALELLEQGRAIVWNRIFHLHTPVDALHHEEPILAMEFTCISKALEHVTNYGSSYEDLSIHSNHSAQNYQHLEFTRISKALGRNYGSSYKDLSTHSNQPLSSKQAILNYQHLVNKWEVLVEKIRKISGFENFLLPIKMAKLQQAAQSGPVVVINVNNSRCDALIVMKDLDEVIHMPLNNFSRERALNLHESLYQLLSKAGVHVRDTCHMQRASVDDIE